MKYVITLNGKKYEVEVEQHEATAVYVGEAEAVQAAPAAPAAEEKAAAAPAQAAPAPAAPAGAGDPVKSPIPASLAFTIVAVCRAN